MEKGTTLTRFLIEEQREHPEATGDFSELLAELTTAAKIIAREVNKAGLAEILGITGRINVHGEAVQKLDEFANATIIKTVDHTGHLAGLASEEMETIYLIPEKHPLGKYILFFDPVDGSSNIDVNVNIGTIFSIHLKKSGGSGATEEDFLQKGSAQLCAGYVIYGSSTMLVYTTGQGVHGFTLDPTIGEFLLSHEDISIPRRGNIYSANESYYPHWEQGIRRYLDHLKEKDAKTGRPYTARYIGSLVADFHRNLLKGGIFLYPADAKSPNGKLRLMYEAAPLAFIAEQAGGKASTGHRRILDISPTELHQRVPLVIGSPEDVEEAEAFIQRKG
ncbi:MAG: fructose-bisphosphatase [Candidatus Handelsmanbacteria bacterium RIFCSPLOWO2_12_FULL_64_10]|uniref:Fructose-1,6-bisphosphatase class 1 n=1 Tax=Handelsmanbacteria sp. (strain RIFCSPLOWO2_12_FULL_64_10) TaxID=1817868 RepID=A0A1F6CYU8_HANXR|nr:MAG: fructose-bisphosphatase [Candidatus Handelsmanbacteria bacterium RIFCSPLOWO2_12_FULL_64_10]